jgi:hypothetical protein
MLVNRRNRRLAGFTVAELAIVLIVICVIFGVGVGACRMATADTVQQRAEQDARNYVRVMHPDWTSVNVTCQSYDGDGDGYVSCSAGNGMLVEALDCRASIMFNYGRGCRQQRWGMRR